MTLPPPPKKSNIWKTLAIALLVVVIILGAIVGVLSTNLLHTNQGTGTNNQVQVSGTVQNGVDGDKLYFTNLDGTIQTIATITNGQYSVLLVGGQSYAVSSYGFGSIVDGKFYPQSTANNFYVPSGVTTFIKNFP